MKSRWRSGWEEHSDPACGPLELPEPGSWGVEDLRVLLLLKRTQLSPSHREARVIQWNRINDTYCVGTASACCDKKTFGLQSYLQTLALLSREVLSLLVLGLTIGAIDNSLSCLL